MEVKDGERHIYANLESCTTSVDSHCKTLQDHHKTACSYPKVLTNTQMKNPACLHKKKSTSKKENTSRQGKCGKVSQVHGKHSQTSTVMVNTDSLYREPEIHSTLHIATALAQARNMQPNVPQLLKNKLDSPNTTTRLKKQPTKEVNVPKTQPVFQELVSLDVSEGALETQLRNILNIRAEDVRHSQGHHDPLPQLSDILNPEEYVSRATITKTSCTSAPATCVQPQKLTRKELCNFSKLVMDLL